MLVATSHFARSNEGIEPASAGDTARQADLRSRIVGQAAQADQPDPEFTESETEPSERASERHHSRVWNPMWRRTRSAVLMSSTSAVKYGQAQSACSSWEDQTACGAETASSPSLTAARPSDHPAPSLRRVQKRGSSTSFDASEPHLLAGDDREGPTGNRTQITRTTLLSSRGGEKVELSQNLVY